MTQDERLFLQDLINEMYQNDSIRSLEGPLLHGILVKLEQASGTLSATFESKENERIQYMLEQMYEIAGPWPVPYIPSQCRNTYQLELISSLRLKLQAEPE